MSKMFGRVAVGPASSASLAVTSTPVSVGVASTTLASTLSEPVVEDVEDVDVDDVADVADGVKEVEVKEVEDALDVQVVQ
ncbi:MAG: hypothetical protein FWD17_19370 [Polyangiaceae bacterium]|nr:hypothetical protein [Polyangiaceae bacterium]